MEAAAAAVAIGGVARCALRVPLLCGLPRPEAAAVTATLTLRLESVTARAADVRQTHGETATLDRPALIPAGAAVGGPGSSCALLSDTCIITLIITLMPPLLCCLVPLSI